MYVEGVAVTEDRGQGRLRERVLTDEKGTIVLSVQVGGGQGGGRVGEYECVG